MHKSYCTVHQLKLAELFTALHTTQLHNLHKWHYIDQQRKTSNLKQVMQKMEVTNFRNFCLKNSGISGLRKRRNFRKSEFPELQSLINTRWWKEFEFKLFRSLFQVPTEVDVAQMQRAAYWASFGLHRRLLTEQMKFLMSFMTLIFGIFIIFHHNNVIQVLTVLCFTRPHELMAENSFWPTNEKEIESSG
jgi:hypothetical protein